MPKPKKISQDKKVRIFSNDVLNNRERGEYFPIYTKNTANNIPQARQRLLPEYYGRFFNEILKTPKAKQLVLSGLVRRKVIELDSPRLVFNDVEAEFLWAKNIINLNISSINLFIELSEKYSIKLLKGEYSDAKETLDIIEANFGASLWLIKNKISFFQLTEGLEAQKRYVQIIKKDLRNNGLIKFIVHWTSIRNEPQTSINRFSQHIESITSSFKSERQQGYKEFSEHHLLGREPETIEGYAQILRLSYSTSIIDYYEALVLLIKRFTVDREEKTKSKATSFLLFFQKPIKDPRFNILFEILSLPGGVAPKTDGIISYEYFLKGNYEEAFNEANKLLKNEPSDVLAILAKAYSSIALNKRTLFDNKLDENLDDEKLNIPLVDVIVDRIAKVYAEGMEGIDNDIYDINKLALNFSDFSWTLAIILTVAREKDLVDVDRQNINSIITMDKVFNPVVIDLLTDPQLLVRYKKLCSTHFNGSLAVQYHQELSQSEPKSDLSVFSIIQQNYLNALTSYKSENFAECITFAENLKASSIGYFVRRGYGLQSNSYLKVDDLENACITAADCYSHNRSFYNFLPLKELTTIIKPELDSWNRVSGLIELSIVFDACVKNLSQSFETVRRFAYEDYLTKNNVDKPSDLKVKITSGLKSKIVYYLRYICLESTMDMSGAFEGGTAEVVAERLAVCRILVDLDSANESIYKQEITDLVRRQVILSRREEIDQSRIYVDIDSVKEWAQSELKEIFARYQAYLRHGVNTLNVTNNFDTSNVKNASETKVDGIEVPSNEVIALMTYMIETIRQSYLSPDVGLDRFISTRIRHGELERNMRSPLQKHFLVTKKQAQDGPYLTNTFWLEKFSSYPDEVIVNLDSAFHSFSESYDNLISDIKNNWLQILRVNKSVGLFDFTLFDKDFARIYSLTDSDTDLTSFIENVISLLDQKLIYTLVGIREKLNTVARAHAKTLLNELQEKTIGDNFGPFLELQTAISQARTDLQAQFDKIIEWFVPSSTGNTTPYELEDAIWVAEAAIKEENPHFTINVETEKIEFLIHGQLPIFVDIFINIFENVVKRSGLDIPTAEIRVWTTQAPEDMVTIIHCQVSNYIAEGVDIVELDSQLKRKKATLQSGNYVQQLATERNSGLFKIYRSVRHFVSTDFSAKPEIDFGVNDSMYEIRLSVPFKIIMLEKAEQI